jgi:Protein of unknown function (DUF3145)
VTTTAKDTLDQRGSGTAGTGTRPLGKANLVRRPPTEGDTDVPTRGVLYIHSAPRALCPHVEWAVAGVLGVRVSLDWTRQPAAPSMWRAEVSWSGEPGTATRLASALRGWQLLRFEVTEEPSAGAEGERYSSTPDLGVFHAVTGVHGDILIPEDRLRAAVLRAERGSDLENELQALLGKPWDDELEPFRCAGDGAPVRWLHQVV